MGYSYVCYRALFYFLLLLMFVNRRGPAGLSWDQGFCSGLTEFMNPVAGSACVFCASFGLKFHWRCRWKDVSESVRYLALASWVGHWRLVYRSASCLLADSFSLVSPWASWNQFAQKRRRHRHVSSPKWPYQTSVSSASPSPACSAQIWLEKL